MDLKWWWLGLALLVVAALVVVAALRWTTRAGTRPDAVLAAHVQRLRRVPRYRFLVRRQRTVAGVRCLAALVLLAGTVVLAARPVSENESQESVANRDIMLCLDVSGSMTDYNREITAEFARIAEDLEGERIGLTIWNEAAVTVFPLTDDYAFIREQLDKATEAFAEYDYDYLAGVVVGGNQASLVGDGLASCVERFDRPDDERGRAVVLATDNDPQGTGVFTLEEAAALAAEKEVVVYGLGAPSMERVPGAGEGFEAAAERTGGRVKMMGEGSLSAIVDGIRRLEAQRMERPPEVVVDDEPWWGAGLATFGLLLVLATGVWGRV